jgi:hypothetical protein
MLLEEFEVVVGDHGLRFLFSFFSVGFFCMRLEERKSLSLMAI